ncbi:hypothetical protein [Chitinophaga sp. RAB17]|uniref:hypothetical protein n=1 Tax=Chitinophaga sp. RAB17 TaxID=3233049 RepID=UPI003F939201
MDFNTRAQQEIHDFNDAISKWFRGTIPADAAHEVLQRLHPDFTMVAPDGSVKTYADLSAWLPSVYGKRPDFVTAATEVITRFITDQVVVITYRETQEATGIINNRMSSVLFISGEDNYIQWRHLQETWI